MRKQGIGMDKVIILGSGGHSKVVVDSIEKQGAYCVAGFVDTSKSNIEVKSKLYKKYELIGYDENLESIFNSGVENAFIGLGIMKHNDTRVNLIKRLNDIGFNLVTVVDPTAEVATSASIGTGTYIGKRAIINSSAIIGNNSIVNTGAIVEHDCVVGDNSHISIGTVLCGNVAVGNNCLIGANATIIEGLTVEDESIIGAGTLVNKDIPGASIAVGVPARVIGASR